MIAGLQHPHHHGLVCPELLPGEFAAVGRGGLVAGRHQRIAQFLGAPAVGVDGPEVGLRMDKSAGLVAGARGVQRLREVVDPLLEEAQDMDGLALDGASLVEWRPGNHGGRIEVLPHQVSPFRGEIRE